MDEYLLDTPEAVRISYPIAGIGTRFLAAVLDTFLMIIGFIAIGLGSLFVAIETPLGGTGGTVIGLTSFFLLLWGYYIFFESLWRGQTPGKKALKIRVIKTDGSPIGFGEAAIRNLLRWPVDFLPSFYGVGVITMFISTESRRLGDFAAGTIVVKERSRVKSSEFTALNGPAEVHVAALGATDPDELGWDLRSLSSTDLTLIRDYLDRAEALLPAARRSLGAEIAGKIAAHIGARQAMDPERFLRRVLELQSAENEPDL